MTFAYLFFLNEQISLRKKKKKVYEKPKLTSDGKFNLQWSHRLKNIKSFYLNSNKNQVSHGFSDCFQLHFKAYYFQGSLCTAQYFIFFSLYFKSLS